MGVFVLFVFVLPGLLANGTFTDDAERLKAENDVRATLLQGLAGAFLLLGLYFTASTLQLNRQGQITERFTRAIDQLGNLTTPEVRLGGIYALERIAKDSENDRETIFAVLAAFLRGHGPPGVEKGKPLKREGLPSEDVRAAAAVLAEGAWRPTERALNLSATDLRGVNFGGRHLEKADLTRANLGDAYLRYAYLVGANLAGANLAGANLAAANLAGANLEGANLEGAKNLNLWHYLSELTRDKQTAFLNSQQAFLESLSPEDLTSFSLSKEAIADFHAGRFPARPD